MPAIHRDTATPKPLTLFRLLDHDVLADPYPLYHRFLAEAPTLWDPFLHAWVVTRYADVLWVLQNFSAKCAPDPQQLSALGITDMGPIADVMVRQMLFMDPPRHTRLRGLASQAFTPRRVEALRPHLQEIVDSLVDAALAAGGMDLIHDFANPLSAIVTAELLGVPPGDHRQLKQWSADFAEILGNFQHNPDQLPRMLRTLGDMKTYFAEAIAAHRRNPRDTVMDALLRAELNGERLTDDEIVSNCILVMVGGQETTPNLIGNGVYSLFRHPGELRRLQSELALVPSAIEELLRYESPSQHTTRIATHDIAMNGKSIRQGQSVIVVMGAANRDPDRFPDPDTLDLTRKDNKHLAFGGGGHFCFGAPLARVEGHIAFETLLRRLTNLQVETTNVRWRSNLGLRGLETLLVTF